MQQQSLTCCMGQSPMRHSNGCTKVLHQDWEIITSFAELSKNEEEQEEERMQFWRSSLQAQQVGNMQPCLGWGNRKSCTPAERFICADQSGALLLLQFPGAGTPHPAPPCHRAGSVLHRPHFLASSDHRSYLTLHSPAQLRVHHNGILFYNIHNNIHNKRIFLLLLLRCPWANATSCAHEEWQKLKKICLAGLALIILIRFFYSSLFSVLRLNLRLVCMS